MLPLAAAIHLKLGSGRSVSLGSSEFFPRDESISILVLVLPQSIGSAGSVFLLEKGLDLLLGDLSVGVCVNFLEEVGAEIRKVGSKAEVYENATPL